MFSDEIARFILMAGIDIQSVGFKLVWIDRASNILELAISSQLNSSQDLGATYASLVAMPLITTD